MVADLAVLYPGCDMVVVFVRSTEAAGKAVVLQSGSGMAKSFVRG